MSNSPISVTRLLGLGLTPGKLRGLQRISNDNGTLTMVATDQNSSMISMIRDSLKKKASIANPPSMKLSKLKLFLLNLFPRMPAAFLLMVTTVFGTVLLLSTFPKRLAFWFVQSNQVAAKTRSMHLWEVSNQVGAWKKSRVSGLMLSSFLLNTNPPSPIVLSTNSNSFNKFTKIAKT